MDVLGFKTEILHSSSGWFLTAPAWVRLLFLDLESTVHAQLGSAPGFAPQVRTQAIKEGHFYVLGSEPGVLQQTQFSLQLSGIHTQEA